MINQKGLTIIAAMFVLIVLSLLGAFMAQMIGVQLATENASLQGAKAHLAAKAGVEWATSYISAGGNCTGINNQVMTFSGLSEFTVTLTCGSLSFTEASANENVYTVTATSQFSGYSNSQYVSRTIQAAIIN